MRQRAVFLAVLVLIVPMTGTAAAMEPTGTTKADGVMQPADALQSTECGFPVTVTDGTGTNVTISEEPTEIVTLGPSSAQTMWEIGGQEKVIGSTMHAHYLDWDDPPENVSASGDSFVSVEKVVALDPDLILAPDIVSNDTVERLRDLGYTVFKFNQPESIDGIEDKTLLIGRLTGECTGAEKTVDWMNDEIEAIDSPTADDRPRVLYVFFGYTAGSNTHIHDVIVAAGGQNVAANANISGFQQINPETVAQQDPEWIVVNDGATQIPETTAYNSTYAVRNDQIVVLEEEEISQAAPRIVHSVLTLSDNLSRSTASTTTTTQTTTPGFGPAVTIVGLLVGLLLFRGFRE